MHRGCTSTGTDAHVGRTIRARVRHVIDKGEGAQSARHHRERGRSVRNTVRREERGGEESR